jgi:hypothetical protein
MTGARLALLLLLACGDDAPSAIVATDASVEDDGFMGCPADVPPLQLQAHARGSKLIATVLAASPVPARRYLNDWTVRFTDASGAALNDVSVVSARTWMPVHGHDGVVMPQVVRTSDPAELQIRSLNFIMRGPWEVQLSLRSASAGDDAVVFHVCIAE